jgi:hypothetical protein
VTVSAGNMAVLEPNERGGSKTRIPGEIMSDVWQYLIVTLIVSLAAWSILQRAWQTLSGRALASGAKPCSGCSNNGNNRAVVRPLVQLGNVKRTDNVLNASSVESAQGDRELGN